MDTALSEVFVFKLFRTEIATGTQCNRMNAIDGKVVRGSYNKSKDRSAIHMVNAFSTAQGICLR